MAEAKELRDTPGVMHRYSGDHQGTVVLRSAILVTDTDEPDYVIATTDQGQPRKLSLDEELKEFSGTYFIKSNGENYALSDFSVAHRFALFGGLPFSKELAEVYVTTGLDVFAGVKDGAPVGVYLKTRDGKFYSREDSSWAEKDSFPEGEEIVPVGLGGAALICRGLDVGLDVTLKEANIRINKK
jgi:hypothetical protein